MKLAELLIQRKAEKNNLAFLEGRLKANAKVQEGEKPQEDPAEVLYKVRASVLEIERLTVIINRTNQLTSWAGPEGAVLAHALATRDSLSKMRRVLTASLDAITVKEPRYGRMEIKYVPVLDASYVLAEIEAVTKEYAMLEANIQRVNWTTEVL